MSQGHSIFEHVNGRSTCTCGFSGSTMEVLGHALPLTARLVADAIAADPTSSPDMIARSEATAQEASEIATRSRA